MTLMEVMIVIVIMLMLMAVLNYGLGRLFVGTQLDTTRLLLDRVASEVGLFRLKNRRWPRNLGEAGIDDALDPWGNPLELTLHEGSVALRSLGRDGVVGGEGPNADILRPIDP
jgi:hypothetical protein